MPKVESIKCPNCGAAVRGAGTLVCPYCGSQLRVEGAEGAYPQFFPAVETESYFNALPGVPITRETKDLPFKPVVVYDNLPGGYGLPVNLAKINVQFGKEFVYPSDA